MYTEQELGRDSPWESRFDHIYTKTEGITFHMKNRFFAGLLLAGILAAPIAAQMPESYLDVDIAKVKMGKRSEFDSINKRMVEINRKNKGDNWLAYQVMYGEPNTIYFVSTRAGYGAAEQGMKAFEGALTKAVGAAGMMPRPTTSWSVSRATCALPSCTRGPARPLITRLSSASTRALKSGSILASLP